MKCIWNDVFPFQPNSYDEIVYLFSSWGQEASTKTFPKKHPGRQWLRKLHFGFERMSRIVLIIFWKTGSVKFEWTKRIFSPFSEEIRCSKLQWRRRRYYRRRFTSAVPPKSEERLKSTVLTYYFWDLFQFSFSTFSAQRLCHACNLVAVQLPINS